MESRNMSRGLWTCEIKLTLVNGQSGCVHLQADKLVTIRELRQQMDKAIQMAETLTQAEVEEATPQWRPHVVNQ
jgi:hypothetical protein